MKCRKFLQFDPWDPARPVWKGEKPETPAPATGGVESAEEVKKKEVFKKMREAIDKMVLEPKLSEQILREKIKTYMDSLPTEEIEIIVSEIKENQPELKNISDELSKRFPYIQKKDKEAAATLIENIIADAEQILVNRKKESEEKLKQEGEKKKEASGQKDPAAEKAAEEAAKAAEAEPTQKKQEAAKTLKSLAGKYSDAFAKYDSELTTDATKARENLVASITDENDKTLMLNAFQILDSEEKEEGSDKTSDALKGAGLGALLERLIDRLTKLFDKLSGELEKLFGSFEKKTAKRILSPLGKDKKITIAKDYEAGKGLTIAADANAEIYSVGGGTVKNIDRNANTVEITGSDGKSRFIYKNIIPDSSLKNGDVATQIEPGKSFLIGKAASSAGILFQYFDSSGTEHDPTENFQKAELIEEETKPEEPSPGPTATADKNAGKKPAKPKT